MYHRLNLCAGIFIHAQVFVDELVRMLRYRRKNVTRISNVCSGTTSGPRGSRILVTEREVLHHIIVPEIGTKC